MATSKHCVPVSTSRFSLNVGAVMAALIYTQGLAGGDDDTAYGVRTGQKDKNEI
jgi:hypothetical protein